MDLTLIGHKIEMWMVHAIVLSLRFHWEIQNEIFGMFILSVFWCTLWMATRHSTAIGNHHAYSENVAVSMRLYDSDMRTILKPNIDDDDETQFMRLLLLLVLLVMNKSMVVGFLCDKYIAAWYNILITIKNSETNKSSFVFRFVTCLSNEWNRVGFVLNHQVVRSVSDTNTRSTKHVSLLWYFHFDNAKCNCGKKIIIYLWR